MTTTSVTFFNGFVAKNGNSNYLRLFWWFCYEEGDDTNVVTLFYGGSVVKKVMVVSGHLLSFFLYLFLWSFWSSSL